jgi:alkylation response protein AidB-like acyl-CoA dehydrogenase
MAIELEMARLITYKAAWKKQQGLPCSMEASMAKVAGSEAGSRCATRGMQVLGGYSYMVEYGMERLYRETKLNEIAGGSNQIQRNIILKNLRRTLR